MTHRLASLIIVATSILLACNTTVEKRYSYIEVVEEQGIMGGVETKEKSATEIMADSDTSAYKKAYQKFCVALKVSKDIKQSLGSVYITPLKFKLLDEKGQDITNSLVFEARTQREKEIEEKIFSMSNSIQESLDRNKKEKQKTFETTAVTDTNKVKELSKFFKLKKDEFANDNTVWYEPKSAPQYINQNGIYCYFKTVNGVPGKLRFKFQYFADDWIFFKTLQFAIDGKAYEYTPDNTETDSGEGKIWEWCDQPLSAADKELIYALANAQTAKVKLVGRQYYNTKTISNSQITSIKQTLDLYKALGGEL